MTEIKMLVLRVSKLAAHQRGILSQYFSLGISELLRCGGSSKSVHVIAATSTLGSLQRQKLLDFKQASSFSSTRILLNKGSENENTSIDNKTKQTQTQTQKQNKATNKSKLSAVAKTHQNKKVGGMQASQNDKNNGESKDKDKGEGEDKQKHKTMWSVYRAVAPKYRILFGLVMMGISLAGLKISDMLEEKFPENKDNSGLGIQVPSGTIAKIEKLE